MTAMPTGTPAPVVLFETGNWWKENNCYDLGVYGLVIDAQDNPVKGMIVEVFGAESNFNATSDEEGRYNIHLGSLLDHEDGATWFMRLNDQGQVVSKELEWNTSRDCEDEDDIQVLYMEWKRKP